MMEVAFVDKCTAIMSHADNEITMDISVFRDNTGFVAVSPGKVKSWGANFQELLEFDAEPEWGVITKVICMDRRSFAILCSTGSVVVFGRERKVLDLAVTALDLFAKDFFLGDDGGNLLLYDDSLSVCKMEVNISSMPIKAIRVRRDFLMVLCADGTLLKVILDYKAKKVEKLEVLSDCVTCFDCSEQRMVWARCDGTVVIDGTITVSTKMSLLRYVHLLNDQTFFVSNGSNSLGVWNYYENVFRKVPFSDLNGVFMCKSLNGVLLLVSEKGIAAAPLIFRSPKCSLSLLFSSERVIEYRQMPSGSIRISHWKPSHIPGSIVHVDGEEDDMFIYVQTSAGLSFINRTNSEWGRILDSTQPILSFSCFRGMLAVLTSDNVVFYENLERKSSIDVENALFVNCEENITCVGCHNSLVVLEPGHTRKVIELSEQPMLARISARMRQIFVVFASKTLVSIDLETSEIRNVAANVSNVFVDTNFGIFFVISGIRVKIGRLNALKLSSFLETSDVAVGICCPTSALIFQSSFYSNTSMSYYFDLSIVGEMDDPHMAASTLLPMRHSKALPSLLQHVAVFAMREKKGDKCVQFLNYFPEHFDICITHALRAVESPERAAALSVLGSCHSIFESMWKRNPRLASLLLPVIMEEDGPVAGFTDAILVLRHFHTSIDDIQSMGRFLDPLLACPDCSNADFIVCVGIRLSYEDYTNLRTSLNAAIEYCLDDLIAHTEVAGLLAFSEAMQTQLTIFLLKRRTMDPKSDFLSVIEKIKASDMTTSECRTLANEMLKARWINWSAALVWCCGSHEVFWKIMDANPRMKKRFTASKWSKS